MMTAQPIRREKRAVNFLKYTMEVRKYSFESVHWSGSIKRVKEYQVTGCLGFESSSHILPQYSKYP